MTNVELTPLAVGVLRPVATPEVETASVEWPEDRWLIGWSPWMGFGKDSQCECHIILRVNGVRVFTRGPHKETSGIYDVTQTDMFPSGYGIFVKKGTPVSLEFFIANTNANAPTGGAANCMVFSVKA